MFIKFGHNADKFKILRVASTMAEVLGDKKLVGAVENKSDNELFFVSRLMSAGVPNANHDFFEEKELRASFGSWVGRGIYKNHQHTDDPSARVGLIIGSWIVDEDKNDVHMVILGKINKDCEPDLAKKIQAGYVSEMSMGCSCNICKCNFCGHEAHTDGEYCDCLKNHLGQTMVRASDGKKVQVYSINREISGTEASFVDQPADSTASVIEVFAKTKDESIKKVAVGEATEKRLEDLLADGIIKAMNDGTFLENGVDEQSIADKVIGKVEVSELDSEYCYNKVVTQLTPEAKAKYKEYIEQYFVKVSAKKVAI